MALRMSTWEATTGWICRFVMNATSSRASTLVGSAMARVRRIAGALDRKHFELLGERSGNQPQHLRVDGDLAQRDRGHAVLLRQKAEETLLRQEPEPDEDGSDLVAGALLDGQRLGELLARDEPLGDQPVTQARHAPLGRRAGRPRGPHGPLGGHVVHLIAFDDAATPTEARTPESTARADTTRISLSRSPELGIRLLQRLEGAGVGGIRLHDHLAQARRFEERVTLLGRERIPAVGLDHDVIPRVHQSTRVP